MNLEARVNRKLIASTTAVVALLALSACSSNDDDDSVSADENGGQTSGPAPGGESEDREISSTPSGDDTSAVAGLWNAEEDGDERYVEIADNGLYTDYDYRGDETGGSNCYIVTPMTLDLELAASDSAPATFSIADGRSFTAATEGTSLAVSFISDDSQEGGDVDTQARTWSAQEGVVAADLPVCTEEEPAGGENLLPGEQPEPDDQTSMPAPGSGPDDPVVVDPAPSETDTSAVAGLWIADSDGPAERIDRRYVLISGDGLYTDYDDQQDPFGNGANCYIVTPRRLDLETGEPDDGTYSASGLPSFTLSLSDGGDTLSVAPEETENANPPVVWERESDGLAAESLNACEG